MKRYIIKFCGESKPYYDKIQAKMRYDTIRKNIIGDKLFEIIEEKENCITFINKIYKNTNKLELLEKESKVEFIRKHFNNLDDAANFESKLYEKYDEVQIITFPNQEHGYYTFSVKK